jgi:ribose transport system substrate-binding protein
MSLMTKRRCQRTAVASTAAVVLALALAACGSKSSTTSTSSSNASAGTSSTSNAGGSLTALKQTVAQYSAAPTTIGPTAPIKKPMPTGKTIVYVNCGAEACTDQGNALSAAAKVLGWKVTNIVAAPTPAQIQDAFQQAVNDHPAGIASAGFDTFEFPHQLAEMKADHIVYESATGQAPSGTNGVYQQVTPVGNIAPDPTSEMAGMRVLADKTIVDAGGKGDIGVVLLTGYLGVKYYTQAYVAQIKSACPACTTTTLNVQPTSIDKDAASIIANWLRANPSIHYVYLSYADLGTGLPQAIKAVGASMPSLYTYAPTQPGIAQLQSGQVKAALAQPADEIGWQIADGFARAFSGSPPDNKFQRWVIWSNDSGNVPKQQVAPPVVANYQAQYEKLWGKS